MKARETKFVSFDTEHRLVTQLVPQIGYLPEYLTLQGFVGRSGRAGHCRIYLDIRVSGFAQFPSAYVGAVALLPATMENPWRPNVVWLEARRLGEERPDDVLVGGSLTKLGTQDLDALWAAFGSLPDEQPRQKVGDRDPDETGGDGSTGTGAGTHFRPPP